MANYFVGQTAAVANSGLVNIGDGGFNGGASTFTGSLNGTELALNAGGGFGGNLIDLQDSGISRLLVNYQGSLITNAPSGYSGNLVAFENGGSIVFKIDQSGNITTSGGINVSGNVQANGSFTGGPFTGSSVNTSGSITGGSFQGPIAIDVEGSSTVIRSQPTSNTLVIQVNGHNWTFEADGSLRSPNGTFYGP